MQVQRLRLSLALQRGLLRVRTFGEPFGLTQQITERHARLERVFTLPQHLAEAGQRDARRRAPVEGVEEAIRPGGISKVKSVRIQAILEAISAKFNGEPCCAYLGEGGAGHFVKMIHNGIEYGMMQAFAEGFDIMRNRASDKLPSDERYDLDLGDIAEVWRRGSVVTSWLLDLTASALAKDAHLEAFSGHVEDSGEGRWTIEAAIEEAVPADVLAASLFVRFRSRQQHTFAEKVLSAMRLGFGGHVEAPKK